MQRVSLSSYAVIMHALERSHILDDIKTPGHSPLPPEDKQSDYAKALRLLRHYELIDSEGNMYLMPEDQEQLKIALLVLPNLCRTLALAFDDVYMPIRVDPQNNGHFRKMVMQVICGHMPCFDRGGRVGMLMIDPDKDKATPSYRKSN